MHLAKLVEQAGRNNKMKVRCAEPRVFESVRKLAQAFWCELWCTPNTHAGFPRPPHASSPRPSYMRHAHARCIVGT